MLVTFVTCLSRLDEGGKRLTSAAGSDETINIMIVGDRIGPATS